MVDLCNNFDFAPAPARDVRAAAFHPLQEMKQLRMTGRSLLGLSPV